MKRIMGIAAVFLAVACGQDAPPASSATDPATAQATPPASTDKPAPHPPEAAALAWVEDDYPAALGAARNKGIPLVIDMWAPWCHTCLSMQAYVLKDPGLRPMANRFVWLALDTDKPEAAPVLEKLPVSAWPTFFVVNPKDETVLARYVGAATVEQFREFLIQGEKNLLEAATLAEDSPLRQLRAADQAAIAGDWKAADAAYGAALKAAGPGWVRRPDVLVSRLSARYSDKNWEGCLELADAHWTETGNSSSAADFVYYAGACADRLPEKDQRRAALYQRAIARLVELFEDSEAPMSLDDRSDAMRIYREFSEKLGDESKARAMAEKQRALLDQAAADAPNAFVAMTYNWHRAEVYVYLGIAKELVPVLEKSEQDLPSQYDPPYRLAWVHLKLRNHDAAVAAAERALEKVYGPRKANVYRLLAVIHADRGDEAAQIAASRKVVEVYEALPSGQQRPAALEAARAKLEELLGGE